MESLYISSPEEYLHKMQGDRKVKVIQESIYLGEFSVTLFDVALYKQGPREDQFYIRNPYYQVNVRRGNSLCLFNELNFCRRGMQKFYDFELRYLERPLNSMTGYHEKVASRVLSLTPPLQMHRLFKENGENCQISYIRSLGRWLVSSKNVMIVVKNAEELVYYPEKVRYIWPRIIAKEWLSRCEEVVQRGGTEFLDFLSEHTLIGEYCGNPEYQHVTRYERVSIIFYAIVPNNSAEKCVPVDFARKFFTQHGLDFVRCESSPILETEEAIRGQLKTWSLKVGSAPMAEEGEGSVVYIEQQGKIVELCKLKTSEYLLFRRIRESLKRETQKSDPHALSKFVIEAKEIMAVQSPPKELKYYVRLAHACLQFFRKNQTPFLEIRYKFVDFLDKVLAKGFQESVEDVDELLREKRKLVKMLVITLPFILEDNALAQIKLTSNLKQIESQFNSRMVQGKQEQRSLAILYLIPKLPYNVSSMEQLEQELASNDQLNLIFLFAGLNQQQAKKALQNLNDASFQKCNPESMSLGVQFATAKKKDQETMIQKWLAKALAYENEIRTAFQKRCFRVEDLNALPQEIDTLFKQFEKEEEKIKQEDEAGQGQDLSGEEEEAGEEEEKDENSSKSPETGCKSPPRQFLQEQQIQVILVYPILLPGCGKTTILKRLQAEELKYPFYYVSSDDVTSGLMKQVKEEKSMQQLYRMVQPMQAQAFNEKLHETFSKIIEKGDLKAVVYLDKNFVPSSLMSAMDHTKAILTDLALKHPGISLLCRNFAILPPKQNRSKLISETIPFTASFIFTLLSRIFSRENHETLDEDVIYKARVLLKLVSLFHHVKFKPNTFKKFNLHYQIELEQFQDAILLSPKKEEHLSELIRKGIEVSSAGRDIGDGPIFGEIISYFYEVTAQMVRPECEENVRKNVANLKSAFDVVQFK